MHRRSLICILLALCLVLSGCAVRTEPPNDYAPDEAHRLTVYTSHKEEVYRPIVREFEARTGIWVTVVTGGTNELLERIASEADAPRADVMFGGGVESLEAYRDRFVPYTCAEAAHLQHQFRAADDIWTPFSALPVVLIYNRKLVGDGDLTSWSDLFDETYRGRIAFSDPSISGSSFTGLVTLLAAVGGDGEETLRRFADALRDRQLASSGAVLSSVAEGSDLVGITLEETARQRIASGDDIDLVYPADGTSCVPDGSALVKGCAHEENAKRFLDFTAGADVQRLLTNSFYRRSVRDDVPGAADIPALDEIALVDYDVPEASARRDALLMTWAFLLGGEEAGT